MSGVLTERLQRRVGAAQCGAVLMKRLFPCGARKSDPTVGSSACADAESEDGNCKRSQVRAFDFFLHIDTASARTYQNQRHTK